MWVVEDVGVSVNVLDDLASWDVSEGRVLSLFVGSNWYLSGLVDWDLLSNLVLEAVVGCGWDLLRGVVVEGVVHGSLGDLWNLVELLVVLSSLNNLLNFVRDLSGEWNLLGDGVWNLLLLGVSLVDSDCLWHGDGLLVVLINVDNLRNLVLFVLVVSE